LEVPIAQVVMASGLRLEGHWFKPRYPSDLWMPEKLSLKLSASSFQIKD